MSSSIRYNPLIPQNLDQVGAGGGGVGVLQLTPDVGGAVIPIANNINLDGVGGNQTVADGPATMLMNNRRWMSQFTVDGAATTGNDAEFTTINAAIAAAVAFATPAVIWVRPGVYSEAVVLFPDISVIGMTEGSLKGPVIISGTVTANYTGVANLQNITVEEAGGSPVQITGVNQTVLMLNEVLIRSTLSPCLTNASTNSFVGVLNSILNAEGASNHFINTGAGEIRFQNCSLIDFAGGSTTNIVSDGQVNLLFSTMATGIQTSATGRIDCFYVQINPQNGIGLDLQAASENDIHYCTIFGAGGSSAVNIGVAATMRSTMNVIDSGAVNVISGTGALNYDFLSFTNISSTLAGTLTITQFPIKPFATTSSTQLGVAYFDSGQFTVAADGKVSSIAGGISWGDFAVSVGVLANTGSFFLPAAVTLSLPTAPAQGSICEFAVTPGASPGVIQATGADKIRVGASVTGAGGSITSTADGDTIKLVYRTGDATWYAVPGVEGVWI